MTGWIPDVVPDQTIESSWGNDIRDRTITPFASAAARTAAIPTPTVGMLTYLQDRKRTEIFDGTLWQPDGPAGIVKAQYGIAASSIVSSAGAYLVIPGSDAILPTANRVYLITAYGTGIGFNPGDGEIYWQVAGVSTSGTTRWGVGRFPFALSWLYVPTTAPQTAQLVLHNFAGQVQLEAAQAHVLDMGPSRPLAAADESS